MKITDEAVEAAFQHWWRASRYRQVILPQPHLEQYARDGFRAAVNALSPAPVGVTDEMVEIVAKKVADFLGYAWEGLNSHSVVGQGYRMFTHGQFGWSFHGGQPDLRNVARDLLEAALASHEPAPTDTQEERFSLSVEELSDILEWALIYGADARDISAELQKRRASSPTTDPQEGVSEAGEVVAYLMEGSTVTWLQSTSGLADCDKPSVTPVPLVRQSALTACQQEVERLREEKRDAYHDGYASRDGVVNACRKRAEDAEARIAELEADLEIANDKLEKMAEALEPFAEVAFDEHADLPDNTVVVIKHEKLLDVTFTLGDFRRARATLGGQSNE